MITIALWCFPYLSFYWYSLITPTNVDKYKPYCFYLPISTIFNMLKVQQKWKPVALDSFLFDGKTNLDGLINIEELKDYSIINKKSNENINEVAKKQDKNVINIKKNESAPDDIDQCIYVTKKKRKKSKQRRSRKKLKNGTSKSETEPSNSDSSAQEKHNEYEISNRKIIDREDFPVMEAWSLHSIPEEILKALSDKNFMAPTEIQSLCLPAALVRRQDVFGAAETGSGKTLAFGIPIITGILESIGMENNLEKSTDKYVDNSDVTVAVKNTTNDKLWAVIVAPTRELVIQVKNHLQDLCKYTKIQVLDIVGGLSIEKQNRKLMKHPHIIVGTPGRLWQLIRSGNEYLSSQIDDIKYLVIDEADRMVEKLHFPELLCLLERINYNPNKHRQTFVFSATLTLVHEPPNYISKKGKKIKQPKRVTPGQKLQSFINLIGAKNPSIIDITQANVVTSGLQESQIQCMMEEKDYYLYYLLKIYTGRKIVFLNGINCVRRMSNLFNILEYNTLSLFANMAQKQRLKNLERFRKNPNGILLATDIAARGLDISNVDYIIHYHVPKTSEIYVHRSGRTARGTNVGNSILLCSPAELYHYNKIRQTLGKGDLQVHAVASPEILKAVKQQVNLARNILNIKTKVNRINSNSNWAEKCAKEMDIELDKDELPEKLNNEEQKDYKQRIKIMSKQLKLLMEKPVLPYITSFKYPTADMINKVFGTKT